MALHWGTEKCKPSLPKDDIDGEWRTGLLWASLGVGLSRIEESNVDEWIFRLRFLERIGYSNATEKYPEAVVRRWIGLWTNATNEKRSDWLRRYANNLAEDVQRDIEYQRKHAPVTKPKRTRKKVST